MSCSLLPGCQPSSGDSPSKGSVLAGRCTGNAGLDRYSRSQKQIYLQQRPLPLDPQRAAQPKLCQQEHSWRDGVVPSCSAFLGLHLESCGQFEDTLRRQEKPAKSSGGSLKHPKVLSVSCGRELGLLGLAGEGLWQSFDQKSLVLGIFKI